jgi:lipoprotein-releasing system ATP-binding protein
LIALRCSRLSCHRPEWADGPSCVHDISLDFDEARLHGITGPAGSGKTLLLHLLGLLDEPDFGTVELFGETVSPASEEIRREVRNTVFGYIFPNPCLLPAFTVAENIAMPLFRISGADEHSAHERVYELVHFFGIERLANEPAANLDFDTQFLTALARAIVHRPRILFLLVPGRSATLAPHVRAVVDKLRITCLWGGLEEDWLSSCDRKVTLQCGSVSAESTPVS